MDWKKPSKIEWKSSFFEVFNFSWVVLWNFWTLLACETHMQCSMFTAITHVVAPPAQMVGHHGHHSAGAGQTPTKGLLALNPCWPWVGFSTWLACLDQNPAWVFDMLFLALTQNTHYCFISMSCFSMSWPSFERSFLVAIVSNQKLSSQGSQQRA